MKKLFFALLSFALVALTLPADARVVRPAPDFQYAGMGGRVSSLKSLRGQPVVLVVARSPRDRSFRRQVANLEELYRRLASRQTVFVAAFTETDGPVLSDIPFVTALNGAGVAANYGLASTNDFGVFVIGSDGNLDAVTRKVLSAERIKEVLDNSYTVQAPLRR
jgi:hypothetical protein